MTLRETIDNLQEMESKAAPWHWSFGCQTAEHAQYSRIYDKNLAALSCFRPYDSGNLESIIQDLIQLGYEEGSMGISLMRRLQEAARRMEE